MMVPTAKVGEVLELKRRAVAVDPLSQHREIGVRSFGRGIFHKEPTNGASLGSKRVFEIRPGDLVLSNVFAWEGAIAVATARETGMIGSHRFMTYVPRGDQIDTHWAAWFFRSELGLELIQRASPGSAGRNRTLAIDRFEATEIPLPPIDEQRRIAARLDAHWQRINEVAVRSAKATELDQSLVESSIQAIIDRGVAAGWPLRPLSEFARVNPPPDRLSSSEAVCFVPMAAVSDVTGTIERAEQRMSEEVDSGYKQFRPGDVIFARITPCMQNGKVAVFEGDTAHAYGSTEFHVVRPGPEARSRWLHRLMRTRRFRNAAAERFTGTAGQQRVPASFLTVVRLPIPSMGDQDKAVDQIDGVLARGTQISKLRERSREISRALLPSLLNEAFGGRN